MNKQVHIIGGGTVFHIRPHLALSAPAYGRTAFELADEVTGHGDFEGEVHLYTTKMAGDIYQAHAVGKKGKITYLAGHVEEDARGKGLETNTDVAKLIDQLVEDLAPKIIFMPVALCDFEVPQFQYTDAKNGSGGWAGSGKGEKRLKSDGTLYNLSLRPAEKIIQRVRKTRKDIFLVGFKTTTGATPDGQFEAGLKLLKSSSCNLVLANDLHTKLNIIVTPEQAPYEPTRDRGVALATLVDMALARAQGHFTRTVEAMGLPIRWHSNVIPPSLKRVVDHCIKRGAYKPFLGSTVGHFAFKVEDNKFVTSMRKSDFNKLNETGMILVETLDETRVIAYGGKPSVGGQSQRIIFKNHPDTDCIVHFHCPLRPEVVNFIPVASQQPHECGSHECGQNTSDHLHGFNLTKDQQVKAVMLDKHGPNIVFNREVDPELVIEFIEKHWDLNRSTSDLLL